MLNTIAHTNPSLVRIDAQQQQNVVPAEPPRLYAIPPQSTQAPLLAMPASGANATQAAPNASRPQLCDATRDSENTALSKNETQNIFSAALVEFVARILIEKMFFQQLHIPQDLLLSLVNNVIQTVAPRQKTKVDVYQEGIVLCKQLMGKALTPEEQRYDNALKEVDVPGEILNGVKYSALALMGSNLYNSVTSAINQGLWNHVPAIVGYGSAIVLGPKLIQGAVEKVLAYSGLNSEQKTKLTPWLNTVGRLALGFIPKVSANEQGVRYHHPSTERHTRIVTSQGAVTLAGDKITLEHQGNVHTTPGKLAANDGMQFRLHSIHEITHEKIRLHVINQEGKTIPLEFAAVQSGAGKEIVVKSSDKHGEAYWKQELQSTSAMKQAKDLSCQSALVLGAVASAVGQNALPALIASLSCWPEVSAAAEIKNAQAASTAKREVMQQQFPAIFNLTELDGANGFTMPGVAASGQLGVSVSTAGDINGDNVTDLVLGAYGENSNLGAGYVIFGSRSPFPASFNLSQLDGTNGFTIPGVAAGGSLGSSISTAGDINGDNITDLVLGAHGVNSNLGSGYVIFGSRSPFPASFNLTQLNGTNGFTVPGVAAGGYLGISVSTAGDINGDNISDLVLGAYGAISRQGASYVIFGSRSPFPASFNLSLLDGTNGFTIPGVAASGQLGVSVSTAGDINGDNITDLVMGAYGANSNQGASYLIFGSRSPFPASFNLSLLDGTNGFTIPGVTTNGYLGRSVSAAGDINGDNITDLVLGAVAATGTSYVIFGSRSPFPASFNLTQINGTNGFTVPGVALGGNLGTSVSTAGDINGDNIADLVLGASAANGFWGASYVIFGSQSPFPASFNLSQLNGINGFTVPGVAASGQLGVSVSTAGDINGDSIADLVLCAYGVNLNFGVSYVIFGQNRTVSAPTPSPAPIPPTLTPCPGTQPLTLQNNDIQIHQAQALRITPNDLSAGCGTNTSPNSGTLFNITGISHAQFRTRNSSGGLWNNASKFLGNDLSQGNVELIHDNSTIAPQVNFTVTDGQTTLPEMAANIQFGINKTTPTVTAINIDIQQNGTTTLKPQQFQINGTGSQLDNVVFSVTSVQGGYFTIGNSSAPIADFTYYQLQNGQIQFVHNGTTLPNISLNVGDGSAAPVSFSPLVTFFSTDNPDNPSVPVEAVVGGAVGAVVATTAVGMTALGIIKYRQNKERDEERDRQTPDLKAAANPLQTPSTH